MSAAAVWEVEIHRITTATGVAPAAKTRCFCGEEIETTDPTELGVFLFVHTDPGCDEPC